MSLETPTNLPHHLSKDGLDIGERSFLQSVLASQAFWVTVVMLLIGVVTVWIEPIFLTYDNFYDITRNFAFIGIMALGMTPVIITGGIDLSVGSTMGLVAIVCGLVLTNEPVSFMPDWWNAAAWSHTWWLALILGLAAGAAVGWVNGMLIAYAGLPPFVVTLGMLSAVRSVAVVFSGNRLLYQFDPDQAPDFKILGAGDNLGLPLPFDLSNPFLILVVLAVVLALTLKMTSWGRHIYAIGGNELAANVAGIPVRLIKLQAYVVCSMSAASSAILSVGWSGSSNNNLGETYELLAVAAAVIGGANLLGGAGTAYGAFIGAALIFVIRNALLMAGVDSNWQGLFVGCFIVLAVALEKVRGKKRG